MFSTEAAVSSKNTACEFALLDNSFTDDDSVDIFVCKKSPLCIMVASSSEELSPIAFVAVEMVPILPLAFSISNVYSKFQTQ